MKIIRYEKGSFVTVPNKHVLRGLIPQNQTLFMWICSYADASGVCFPSINRLVDDCGMSKSTVVRRLKELEKLKLLKRKNRKKEDGTNNSNIYQINLLKIGGDGVRETLGVVSERHHDSVTVTPELNTINSIHKNSSIEPSNEDSESTPYETHEAPELPQKLPVDTAKEGGDSTTLDGKFNQLEYFKASLENDKQRHVRLIAFFVLNKYNRFKRPVFHSKEAAAQMFRRYARAAKSVSHFEDKDINNALEEAFEKVGEETTLETVYKYLTK